MYFWLASMIQDKNEMVLPHDTVLELPDTKADVFFDKFHQTLLIFEISIANIQFCIIELIIAEFIMMKCRAFFTTQQITLIQFFSLKISL